MGIMLYIILMLKCKLMKLLNTYFCIMIFLTGFP